VLVLSLLAARAVHQLARAGENEDDDNYPAALESALDREMGTPQPDGEGDPTELIDCPGSICPPPTMVSCPAAPTFCSSDPTTIDPDVWYPITPATWDDVPSAPLCISLGAEQAQVCPTLADCHDVQEHWSAPVQEPERALINLCADNPDLCIG